MADADHQLTLAILKDIRADAKKLQDLLLSSIESNRRHFAAIEPRFDIVEKRLDSMEHQIKDSAADMETMLKGELLGRLTHFESRIDQRLAELEERAKPAPTA